MQISWPWLYLTSVLSDMRPQRRFLIPTQWDPGHPTMLHMALTPALLACSDSIDISSLELLRSLKPLRSEGFQPPTSQAESGRLGRAPTRPFSLFIQSKALRLASEHSPRRRCPWLPQRLHGRLHRPRQLLRETSAGGCMTSSDRSTRVCSC